MIANITSPSLSELHRLQAQIPSLKIMEVTRQPDGLNILVRHDDLRYPVFFKKAIEIIVADKLDLHIKYNPSLNEKKIR
jgi:hypothetical protein